MYIITESNQKNSNESIREWNSIKILALKTLFWSLQVRDMMERGDVQDVSSLGQEEVLIQQAEHSLQFKERQLQSLHEKHLPAVSEERQRAIELLERVRGGAGSPALDRSPEDLDKELDETLYQVKLWGRAVEFHAFLYQDIIKHYLVFGRS